MNELSHVAAGSRPGPTVLKDADNKANMRVLDKAARHQVAAVNS